MRKRLCLRGRRARNRLCRAVGPQGSVWTPLSGIGFGWCCVEPEVTAGNPHVPLRTWDTQRAGTDLPHLTAASAPPHAAAAGTSPLRMRTQRRGGATRFKLCGRAAPLVLRMCGLSAGARNGGRRLELELVPRPGARRLLPQVPPHPHVVRISPGMGSSGTDSQLSECCRLFPWGGWGGVVGAVLFSLRALVPELLWCRLFVLLHV